jgi:hypothetical protein
MNMKLICCEVALAVASLSLPNLGHARDPNPSTTSAGMSGLSMALPVAASMVGTASIFAAGATLVVVSVQITASGTVWILQRLSDGVRLSVRWAGEGAKAASMAAGTTLQVAALSSGWLLVQGSEAMAFVPNEVGQSLIYSEKLTY